MKRIYSEPTPIFIHQIKDFLEKKGIQAIVKNEMLSGGIGELPPTEVWPELWVVNNEDKNPAKTIVDNFLDSIKSTPKNWVCSHCGEKVEGHFNICWNCGESYK